MKLPAIVVRTFVVFAATLLAIAGAEAKIRPLTLPETAALASDIVIATCSGQSVNQAPGNGQLVFTTWTFKRESAVKDGGLPETFSVRIVGGTVGKLRVTVPDAPVFQRGKPYLVFLKPSLSGSKRFTVCGGRQGVLEARKGADGAWEVRVTPPSLGESSAAGNGKSASGDWLALKAFSQVMEGKGGRQ